MTFFQLMTSKEDAAHDPRKIIIKGVSTTDKEVVLFDSDNVKNLIVDERGSKISSTIGSDDTYKKYITTFVRKSTTKYIYVGHYAIVQVYTSECGASILKELGLELEKHTHRQFIVKDGIVQYTKQTWPLTEDSDGKYIQGGVGAHLIHSKVMGIEDFRMHMLLKFKNVSGSASSVTLYPAAGSSSGNIGFSGSGNRIFVEGGIFGGGATHLGYAPDFGIVDNALVKVEVTRKGSSFVVKFNDKIAYSKNDFKKPIGNVAIRTHRTTVNMHEWTYLY